MAPGAALGVNQLAVHRNLEHPALRGFQGDPGDLVLELVQQLGHQTGGTIGIVSNCAVFDGNREHVDLCGVAGRNHVGRDGSILGRFALAWLLISISRPTGREQPAVWVQDM